MHTLKNKEGREGWKESWMRPTKQADKKNPKPYFHTLLTHWEWKKASVGHSLIKFACQCIEKGTSSIKKERKSLEI